MSIRERDAACFGANDLPAIQLWRDRRTLLAALDALVERLTLAALELHQLHATAHAGETQHIEPWEDCENEACVLDRSALAAAREATDGR